MFKWDRLLRKKRIGKIAGYKDFEYDMHESDLHPGHTLEKPEETGKNEEEEYEIVEIEILPAKIICPDCRGITLEGLDFCDKCGGEL